MAPPAASGDVDSFDAENPRARPPINSRAVEMTTSGFGSTRCAGCEARVDRDGRIGRITNAPNVSAAAGESAGLAGIPVGLLDPHHRNR